MRGVKLYHGDFLEVMKDIPEKSVDLVLTDPPYGTTACRWDTVIPFESMWANIKRVVKDNAAVCLFGSEPFSSHLRLSNLKQYKYDWIWHKSRPTGFMQAKRKPLNTYENISFFSDSSMSAQYGKHGTYNLFNLKPSKRGVMTERGRSILGKRTPRNFVVDKEGYPKNIIKFKSVEKTKHPTQKPVHLLEYLIKTYTLEGETVLDFTMGSGSTGVAAVNLNRKFIGIEIEKKYFDIAKKRISEAYEKMHSNNNANKGGIF